MWSESVHGYQLPDLQRVEPSRNVQLPYAIFAFYPTRVWQKYLCMHANMSIWFNWNVMHMYTQGWICICSLHIHFFRKKQLRLRALSPPQMHSLISGLCENTKSMHECNHIQSRMDRHRSTHPQGSYGSAHEYRSLHYSVHTDHYFLEMEKQVSRVKLSDLSAQILQIQSPTALKVPRCFLVFTSRLEGIASILMGRGNAFVLLSLCLAA